MATLSTQNHNYTVFTDLREGDNVEFKRGLYSHWAVYVGEGKVVHMAGVDDDGINGNVNSGHSKFTICGRRFDKACVKIDDFWDVVGDSKVFKNNRKDNKYKPYDVDEIVERALSRVGEIGYNVLWQNCEHFASFCRYGTPKSDQVDKAITAVSVGAVLASLASLAISVLKAKSKSDTS